MRLTIVVPDGLVVVDGIASSPLTWDGTPVDVHALQWYGEVGNIEFVSGLKPNEQIDTLPQWASNAYAAWVVATTPKPPEPPTADFNKSVASDYLFQTDWTTIPDVSDPTKSNPYLANVSEFVVYRNQVRQIAINPVAGYIDWPTVPQAVWQTTEG